MTGDPPLEPKRSAVVFAAAPLRPTRRLLQRLRALQHPLVVAADGGARTAQAFGFTPDIAIGDFDSLDAAALAALTSQGTQIDAFPRDKEATDGQLAVERALASEPSVLVLLGFLGGPRFDQAMANALLLQRLAVPTVLLDEHNEVTLLRGPASHRFRAEPNEIVSLIPLGDDAEGVSATGLRWPLEDERLTLGDTRGISNEPVSNDVGVAVGGGALLVARYFPAADG